MEVLTNPAPPPSLLEHQFLGASGELSCWSSPASSVRIEPREAGTDVKLLTPLQGQVQLNQHGQNAILRPGEYCLVDPSSPFELTNSQGRFLYWRLPEYRLRQRHSDLDLQPAVVRGAVQSGERIVSQVLQAMGQPGLSLDNTGQATALSVLLEALGLGPRLSSDHLARKRVSTALGLIELRLHEQGLQAEHISREQGVSRRYLDSLMHEQLGQSLMSQIRLRRLERAAELLRTSSLDSFAAISWRCGFRNQSHFSRLFRQHYGVAPTAYRDLSAHQLCASGNLPNTDGSKARKPMSARRR